MSEDRDLVGDLAATADRLDSLADTAELMGDEAGAARLRAQSATCREHALRALDDVP
ncbi:MAG: hypothetical protein ACJ739_14395 [Acidimicrobiales bacterium]